MHGGEPATHDARRKDAALRAAQPQQGRIGEARRLRTGPERQITPVRAMAHRCRPRAQQGSQNKSRRPGASAPSGRLWPGNGAEGFDSGRCREPDAGGTIAPRTRHLHQPSCAEKPTQEKGRIWRQDPATHDLLKPKGHAPAGKAAENRRTKGAADRTQGACRNTGPRCSGCGDSNGDAMNRAVALLVERQGQPNRSGCPRSSWGR